MPDTIKGSVIYFSEKLQPIINLNFVMRSKAFPIRKIEAAFTKCNKCAGCRNFNQCDKAKNIEEGKTIPKEPSIDDQKSFSDYINRFSDSILTATIILNLPIPGSYGIHLGLAYSIFKKESVFNMALGSDVGFSFAQDEFRMFGLNWSSNSFSSHAFHFDVFAPVSIKLNEYIRLIATPRYSFNNMRLKKMLHSNIDLIKFKPRLKLLSIGLFIDRLYLEYSSTYYKDLYYPNFGAAYTYKF